MILSGATAGIKIWIQIRVIFIFEETLLEDRALPNLVIQCLPFARKPLLETKLFMLLSSEHIVALSAERAFIP